MSISITLLDEVNCLVDGLTVKQTQEVIERTKLPVAGAHMQASFKTGNWDGKESLFDASGLCFQFMLDDVIEILDTIGTDLSDIEIIDDRDFQDCDFPTNHVDENFMLSELGYTLRSYQTKSINAVIDNHFGIVNAGTGAGKTAITAAISKVFDPYYRSLILVPSNYLVTQTSDTYALTDLNYINLKDYTPKKRAKAVANARHVICTYQMLLNEADLFDGEQWVVIGDEIHRFGDQTADVFRYQLRNCPVRVGLTGTIPKDKLKAAKIRCHINGDMLVRVSPKELMDGNYVAKATIKLYTTDHPDMEELSEEKQMWDWDAEFDYQSNHRGRLDAIVRFIKSLPEKNTLILCHPQLGLNIAEHFDGRMIHEETPDKIREEWLNEFDVTEEPYYLPASYQTAGTGISVNQIHRVILIDVGKNETITLQSIGRGMRLDGKTNEVEIIDICAKTKYGKRHQKDRIKLYKREKFPYTLEEEYIEVKGD